MDSSLITMELKDFGYRELKEIAKILIEITRGGMALPEDFEDDDLTINFNTNSGYVFLSNSNYEVAMLLDGKLESFYSCPECGEEGFFQDIKDHSDEENCKEYIKNISQYNK